MPLKGPGFVAPKALIDVGGAHVLAHSAAPGARQIRLVDIARGDVLECTLHCAEESLRLIFLEVPVQQAANCRSQLRRGGQIRSDLLDACGASGLGHDPRLASRVLVHERGRRADGLSDRTAAAHRQAQARLDLARELIAEIDQPAAGERQRRRLAAGALSRRPCIQLAQEGAVSHDAAVQGHGAIAVQDQRSARLREQNVEPTERPADRRTFEQGRILRGRSRMQREQSAGRKTDGFDERPGRHGGAPAISRGCGRSGCRSCRRSRTSSTAPRAWASRARRWGRSRDRSLRPGCRD